MPDFSLGFVKETPPSGYSAYGGKGTYISKINLSNQGLKGSGTIKYLTSTAYSDDFTFFPDSTNAKVKEYQIKEQKAKVEYPLVNAQDVNIHWQPYKDIMRITQISKPIELYTEKASLKGGLVLQPTGLTGAGLMEFSDAEIDSKLFSFKQRVIDADTANFRLRSYDM